MSKKIRIFIANDASHLGTGYGVYGKEILTRLSNSDEFEVAELACYAHEKDERIKNTQWKIYPNAPLPSNEQETKAYNSAPIHQFGQWRFNTAIAHFKPDIVFDIRDYWMYSYQEVSFYQPYFKWIVMPTVDSAPQKLEWLDTFANMDLIVPYTEWAYNVLKSQCGSSINLFDQIANAGVNPKEFAPINNKKEHQKNTFGKEVSITGAIMRNQKRKLFPDLLQSYRKYLDRLIKEGKKDLYEKSYLYLHTSYPEANGWELADLLLENNIVDKVYFTYHCNNCKHAEPQKFAHGVGRCPNCGKISMMMPNASHPVSTEILNSIYNLFDFYVQYAICEGFGMPQVEAASCGIPIASVEYSAMTEIVKNLDGYAIPVKRLFREMETTANRAYPDNDALVGILWDFFVVASEEERKNRSQKTRELCAEKYTWDNVYNVWVNAFRSVDLSTNLSWDKPNPNPISDNLQVPNNLQPAELIDYIIINILREPYLLNTALIRNMKKKFSIGVTVGPKGVSVVKAPDIIKELEMLINNKKLSEDLRLKAPTLELGWLNV